MIGVGILGCGGIARAHARAYGAFRDRCRVAAVADVFPHAAEALARELGGGVAACAGPEDLLARADVDLVSICTPPFEHARLTVAALSAGKHVLVEKPMATTLEECDAMIATAHASGRTLSVVHQYRWNPEFVRLKALVDSGALGTLDLVAVSCLWWRGPEYYRRWWRGTWDKEGGGALLNHAVHHVDLMVWLAGMPSQVQAVAATRAHAVEVDDLVVAVLGFPGGAVGQFTGTVDAHLNEERLEVCGRRAAVAVPWRVRAMTDAGDGFGQPDEAVVAQVEEAAARVEVPERRGHAAQVDALLQALERGSPPPVSGEEGRCAVEVVSAMYAAAAGGRPCTLPLAADHPFYRAAGMRPAMRALLAPRRTDAGGGA